MTSLLSTHLQKNERTAPSSSFWADDDWEVLTRASQERREADELSAKTKRKAKKKNLSAYGSLMSVKQRAKDATVFNAMEEHPTPTQRRGNLSRSVSGQSPKRSNSDAAPTRRRHSADGDAALVQPSEINKFDYPVPQTPPPPAVSPVRTLGSANVDVRDPASARARRRLMKANSSKNLSLSQSCHASTSHISPLSGSIGRSTSAGEKMKVRSRSSRHLGSSAAGAVGKEQSKANRAQVNKSLSQSCHSPPVRSTGGSSIGRSTSAGSKVKGRSGSSRNLGSAGSSRRLSDENAADGAERRRAQSSRDLMSGGTTATSGLWGNPFEDDDWGNLALPTDDFYNRRPSNPQKSRSVTSKSPKTLPHRQQQQQQQQQRQGDPPAALTVVAASSKAAAASLSPGRQRRREKDGDDSRSSSRSKGHRSRSNSRAGGKGDDDAGSSNRSSSRGRRRRRKDSLSDDENLLVGGESDPSIFGGGSNSSLNNSSGHKQLSASSMMSSTSIAEPGNASVGSSKAKSRRSRDGGTDSLSATVHDSPSIAANRCVSVASISKISKVRSPSKMTNSLDLASSASQSRERSPKAGQKLRRKLKQTTVDEINDQHDSNGSIKLGEVFPGGDGWGWTTTSPTLSSKASLSQSFALGASNWTPNHSPAALQMSLRLNDISKDWDTKLAKKMPDSNRAQQLSKVIEKDKSKESQTSSSITSTGSDFQNQQERRGQDPPAASDETKEYASSRSRNRSRSRSKSKSRRDRHSQDETESVPSARRARKKRSPSLDNVDLTGSTLEESQLTGKTSSDDGMTKEERIRRILQSSDPRQLRKIETMLFASN